MLGILENLGSQKQLHFVGKNVTALLQIRLPIAEERRPPTC
jgi:hypothetical protein